MKYPLLLLLLFGSISITHVTAQTPQPGDSAEAPAIAAKKAAAETDIVQMVSPGTGKISYYRKNVCLKSGKESLTEVRYCSKSGKFIHAASYGKTNCLKTGPGCVKDATAAKASQSKECTPAQKAACYSAAAKTAAAKKAKAWAIKLKIEKGKIENVGPIIFNFPRLSEPGKFIRPSQWAGILHGHSPFSILHFQ